MKRGILLFALGAGISYIVLSSNSAGVASVSSFDCTGAEAGGTLGNTTGCTGGSSGGSCHGTTATSTISVSIELDSAGVPIHHYFGGNTYTVKLTGTNGTGSSLPKYGFQLTAITGTTAAATVSNAGTWGTPPTGTQLVAPIASSTLLNIVEQTSAQTATGTTFTQSFTWTAPTSGTGTISFWASVNFVNGNTAVSGDKWNIGYDSVREGIPVGVAEIANNIGINVFPNPVINNLNVELTNVGVGDYAIQVYDLNGKIIENTNVNIVNSNNVITVSTQKWVSGIYQVAVIGANLYKTVSVFKQ